jgi:predicted naringenin-chalcone synthase
MMHIRQLGTVAGAHTYAQARLANELHAELERLGDARAVAQLVRFVYEHSAIVERHLEVPLEEARRRHDWFRMVNEATLSLCLRSLEQLFADEGATPASACDGLVAVSSSHAGFPGLTRLAQERLGFPLNALAFDLGALGCAGPTQGLYLAATLVANGACRNVAVVCVDAMATHGAARRHDHAPSLAQVVAHCLASDGAAALLVSRDPGPRPLLSFRAAALQNQLWPGALDLNDFTADADNQPFMSVGKEIRNRVVDELKPIVEDPELRGSPILFHPGGAALMKLLADRWPELGDGISISCAVLAQHGNLGSSSLLWVLAEALARRATLTPRLRLAALGPGIVSTLLTLDGVER